MSEKILIAGRYEEIQVLGQGSFGQTVLAHDEAGRLVAIKKLRPERVSSFKSFELFAREASVLQSLRHHGIPAVLEHFRGQDEETAYLVMEYIEGPSLARILEEGRHLDPEQVLQLTLGLLDILDYLHNRVPPILHRDIKPGNVLLRPDGTPALVDFGAVRNVFRAAQESGSTVVGTYGYMPFEQYMGQASPASDLYAVGATLLHLLTGRPPSDFFSEAGHIEVPADLPGGDVLRRVLARLLERTPSARFQTARQVRQALLAPVLGAAPMTAASPSNLPVLVKTLPGGLMLPDLVDGRRPLEGAAQEQLQRILSTPWRALFPGLKMGEPMGGARKLLTGFLAVATIGILPGILYATQRVRRERLKSFFERGLPAVARLLDLRKNDQEFFFMVSYEFEVDGEVYRGADHVFPVIARLWHAGDRVQILYDPQRDYDSVIISTR